MDFNSVLTYYLGVGKHFINTALGVNLTESGSRSVNFDVRGYPSKDDGLYLFGEGVYQYPSRRK